MTNVFDVMLHRTVPFVEKTRIPIPPTARAASMVIGSQRFP